MGLALGLVLTVLWIAAASVTATLLRHEMDEVFDVNIVVGLRCGKRSSKMACLTVSRSVAASMIRSEGPMSASRIVVLIRAIAAALSSGVTLPRLT